MLSLTFRAFFVMLALSAAFMLVATTFAQDDPSPTPAPSKTPTAAPSPTATARPASASAVQSFTQSDLTVLTGNVQRPNGITFLDGVLYTACTGDFTVYQIEAETGRTVTYAGGIRNAHMLYVEIGDDDRPVLWAPDFQMNQFLRVVQGRTQTISGGLDGPWGIAYLNEDEFLITNLLGNNMVVVSREGGSRTILDDLANPTGIVIDDDLIYVGNNGSTRRAIEWYPLETAESDEPVADAGGTIVSGIQNVTGLALDSEGMLYFAYALGTRGVVGRVDPQACIEQGGCGNAEVEVVLFTELSAPLAGLTISPDNRLFVHTMFAPDIYWVQLPE
ncbi:MAG: hypothetical protein IH587_11660 [Anaerolineae bacterium]|nr:hypothetical protein [Anaerolineae bacterium]